MRSWLSVLIADARTKKRDDIPIAPSLYSLSNKMDNSLLAVRDINHKYIVVEMEIKIKKKEMPEVRNFLRLAGNSEMNFRPAGVCGKKQTKFMKRQ